MMLRITLAKTKIVKYFLTYLVVTMVGVLSAVSQFFLESCAIYLTLKYTELKALLFTLAIHSTPF